MSTSCASILSLTLIGWSCTHELQKIYKATDYDIPLAARPMFSLRESKREKEARSWISTVSNLGPMICGPGAYR